ncbi:MAG: DUF456 domain-containing protein [Salegentibacter sp.]
MEILILIASALLVLVGLIGSIIPILPGVPVCWAGLFFLYLTPGFPLNYWFLGITLAIAILIYVLNLLVPAMGTKRYGGSKAGMTGATLGLIAGLIAPVPLGVIIGPFIGAFIGELINKSDSHSALKAAFGSFVGFLASTFMEFLVSLGFLVLFLYKVWEHRELFF